MADDHPQIDHDDEPTGSFPEGDPEEAPTASFARSPTRPSGQIGPYRLLQKIGEGGMGEVWLAEQTEPVKRRVAIKVIKRGMDSKAFIARFEAERQALAMMDHPTIAKVFDAGETSDGRPFFVMEHIQGVPITSYCDDQRLSTRERLELFSDVCAGVQHAHQKAIIHRDLKPSNVLVAIQDGKAVPKLIDFGVAKAMAQPLTEKTMFTELGQMIGTPAYMSPEQAEMSGLNVDTRTDVYSLGVLLYQLLVGALPFDPRELRKAGYSEMMRVLREDEPPRPSTRVSSLGEASKASAEKRRTEPTKLRSVLRGDLDWIVMKALEKDRNRRYDTANGLAMDVKRHLANQPVLAGPPSKRYRAKKFVQRHRAAVVASALFVITLLGFVAAMSILFVRANRAEAEAVAARDESEAVTTFLADMLAAVDPSELGREVTVREALDQAAKTLGDEFAERPLIESRLRHTIGATYTSLGAYEAAEAQLPAAVDRRRALLGEAHPDTLESKSALATLYSNQGRQDDAEALKLEVYETLLRDFGFEDRRTLEALNDLSLIYILQDRLDEAEALLDKGLATSRKVLGGEDEVTLHLMNALSNLYWEQRRRDEMAELNIQILDLSNRLHGPDHPETISSIHNLATSYFFLASDYNEAGLFQERDDAHLKAADMYLDAIERGSRVRGEDHQSTLTSQYMLAITYMNLGRDHWSEAERLLREVTSDRERTLGPDHPNTLSGLGQLGRLFIKQSRWSEANRLMTEAVERSARVRGNDHTATATYRYRLGITELKLGRVADAETTLLAAYHVIHDKHGTDFVWAKRTATAIIDVYEAMGRSDEAARWRATLDPEWLAFVERSRAQGMLYD